jgi:hypothetical protein
MAPPLSRILRVPFLLALIALFTIGPSTNAAGGEFGEFKIENALGTYPIQFSATGGATKLTSANGGYVSCTSSGAKGKYTSATGGEVQLTFHGCTYAGISSWTCTTSGQPTGTIVTATKTFDNFYLESDKSKRGFLITGPNSGEFEKTPLMTFACLGTVYTVGGSLFGEMTKPSCGSTGKELSVSYEKKAEGIGQRWRWIETITNQWFEMFVRRNAISEWETFVLQSTLTGTFGETVTLTCP